MDSEIFLLVVVVAMKSNENNPLSFLVVSISFIWLSVTLRILTFRDSSMRKYCSKSSQFSFYLLNRKV